MLSAEFFAHLGINHVDRIDVAESCRSRVWAGGKIEIRSPFTRFCKGSFRWQGDCWESVELKTSLEKLDWLIWDVQFTQEECSMAEAAVAMETAFRYSTKFTDQEMEDFLAELDQEIEDVEKRDIVRHLLERRKLALL